jgi:hypothetical protein
VKLVEQWNRVESGLDPNWNEARVVLVVADAERCDRAVALLGPANPGRSGTTIRLSAVRRGAGVGPEAIRRMLRRLDAEHIRGKVELAGTGHTAPALVVTRRTLVDSWDAAVASLPSDWSDLLCQLDLTSTDHLDRAALLAAPINPTRFGEQSGYRFRCARSFGYGASPGMVRRCFDRLDDEHIPGDVQILRALSDTHPNATQGPVWYVNGKAV